MDELKKNIDQEMERFYTKQLIYSHKQEINNDIKEMIEQIFQWANIQGLNGVKLWDLDLNSPSKNERKNVTCKAIEVASLFRTTKC